ncbi:MAG: MDR family MFS transporter [Acidobacteriota bacterium]
MNPWRSLGGLDRAVWVLCATTLINRMGTMVLPFLVLYLSRGLHLSPAQAGLALTVYGAGALLMGPFAGRLCDRVGALGIMAASLFLSGAALLLFPLVRGFGPVLAATFLWALVNEAYRPAAMALLAGLAAPGQRKAVFALNRLAVNLGMSVGPALGGFLAMVDFRWLFWVDGATSLLAFGFLWLMTPRRETCAGRGATSPEDEGAGAPSERALANGPFLFFLAAIVPTVVVFFQIDAAFPLHLVKDLHMPEAVYGLFFTVNTVLIIFLEVPLNGAMARWSHRRSLALGALLTGAGFGALALAGGYWSVGMTVVIWTFGEMILFPGSAAAVADWAPPDRRGEYMGLYAMTFSLCFTAGPWLGTLVLEKLGPRPLWGLCLLLGCCTAAMVGSMGSLGGRREAAAA